MGKLVYLISAVIVIQVALFIVFGIEIPGSSLFALFTNPQANWNTLAFSVLLKDAITAVSLGAIIIGTLFFKSDFMVLAGVAGVFYTFGSGLGNLWQQVCSNIWPYIDPTALTCNGTPALISSIIVGPIVFLYIFVIFEWWRGRD